MPKRNPAGANGASASPEALDRIQFVSLSQETRRRYLNYAMSVIQSRALPDVRDGLKPVQRRILYVMYEELRLMADSKTRKCAKIVGDTTGNYHPHGDMAVYDALVRMAQDFALRCPLIDGQGNFGSLMGLPAAASRYTEARLTATAEQLMNELRFNTVDMRPNYDGTREEPVVLPARYPNLLVNGTTGIAVGMATNMPPHNLKEVLSACTHLIDNPDATTRDLLKFVKGPDFPLGGRMMTDRKELLTIYEEGRGGIKVRGEYRPDKDPKGDVIEDRLVIHSIPYGVESSGLVQEIGTVVAGNKLPQLLDVSDETSDELGLRIVLQLKPGADPTTVLAYLYKHTTLEQNFAYNSTCLVPDAQGLLVPARLSLVDLLWHFLNFRMETVRRRSQFQLQQLEKRIHLLEGFAVIFDELDKALKLIRASSGRRDAADKLMAIFPLDEDQTFAVLDLALYRISTLEIGTIREELRQKVGEAEKLRKVLASDKKLWSIVQSEFNELSETFGEKRRTTHGSSEEITEFDPSAYIVRENTNLVLTRDGWVKRVGRLQSIETTRVREGDTVLDVLPGSTLDHAIFFASDGVAYTLPMNAIPVSSGYGEPLTKHVRTGDGVAIVAALSTDSRFVPEDTESGTEEPLLPYLLITTAHGNCARIPLSPFRAASTKTGRKYCRLQDGDRVVGVDLIGEGMSVFLATRLARVIHFSLDEIPVLSGAGRGVRGIKLEDKDELLGAAIMIRPSDCLRVVTSNEKQLVFGQQKYELTSRGGKGQRAAQRSQFLSIERPPVALVDWAALEAAR